MRRLVVLLLLLGGCGFRHCTELSPVRDDARAALCEAKCRCPEGAK